MANTLRFVMSGALAFCAGKFSLAEARPIVAFLTRDLGK